MAYSTTNPPSMVSVAPLVGSGQLWVYKHTDASAVVDAAGYITNAKALGMRVNDLVNSLDTSTGITSVHRVVTVNATTGVADLGDGTVIGAVTNTD